MNNNTNNNKQHLENTVHWRRVKNIYKNICDENGIDISGFDLNNCVCYNCTGESLQGKNVSYYATRGDQLKGSIFVYDNDYTVFEAPSTKNVGSSYEGDFLILAQNTSFDYWVAGSLQYSVSGESKNTIDDAATYWTYGKYVVTIESNESSKVYTTRIMKPEDSAVDFGRPRHNFDQLGVRKKAYGTSYGRMLAGLNHRPYSDKDIVNGKNVKRYNKKNKK